MFAGLVHFRGGDFTARFAGDAEGAKIISLDNISPRIVHDADDSP
jgi:hypothetical protein